MNILRLGLFKIWTKFPETPQGLIWKDQEMFMQTHVF